MASSVMEGMFALPQPSPTLSDQTEDHPPSVTLSEDSQTLQCLMRLLYADMGPKLWDLNALGKVLDAAEKYEMANVTETLAVHILPQYITENPLHVFALASRHNLTDIIPKAASASLRIPFPKWDSPELSGITGAAYHKLVMYRQRCQDAAVASLTESTSQPRARDFLNPTTPLIPQCSSCPRNPVGILDRYGNLPLWFIDHLDRAREALIKCADGEAVTSLAILEQTINKLPVLGTGPSQGCQCAAKAPAILIAFSRGLAVKIETETAKVSVNISDAEDESTNVTLLDQHFGEDGARRSNRYGGGGGLVSLFNVW
ncbi:hypothetical protein PHLCEN_2v7667 [Hermanssonia centrifuga]|uniref:BTB/POZ domain-containing protein n=1 Tax=Hermanssonia centrifuga TaxID=98765 RepID=A0A2R6NVW1_9APHY|nr:hypothetical protein PHLCEN_2v7667 [Hermanssonia centrifuga]